MSLDPTDTAEDHGLAHARRLVTSILHQITEGDAPSGNFEGNNAIYSRTGSNHGGYSQRGSGALFPTVKFAGAGRSAPTLSQQSLPSDGQSQGDDAASTTASEFSVASSPFNTPKPSSRFPPRPPSSSSSQRREMGDASNHSGGMTPSNHSAAPCHTIGASLMGAVPLADLCTRTIESGSDKGERSGRRTANGQSLSGTLPPPPLSPLESEGSSPGNNAEAGLGKLAMDNLESTRRASDGEMDSSFFDAQTTLDEHGFPCEKGTSADTDKSEYQAVLGQLVAGMDCNAESGSSNYEDAVGEEIAKEETAPTVPKPRIRMFGSEYARILSSAKPQDNAHPASASKMKRMKARCSSSAKESVDSGSNVVLSLEDCPQAVATAAMTDVIVTSGTDIPPRGYYRAFPLGEESTKNLVPGLKRQRLFLNVKKEPNWDRAVQRPCVTAFCVIYPDRNEFVPPGFSVVRLYKPSGAGEGGSKKKEGDGSGASPAANINLSSSGERVYICYRRSREGNPITGVMCLRPSKGDVVLEGFSVLERTPRNFLADLSAKSEHPSFLAYRQRLENLECLRPLPLVMSVLHAKPDAGRRELKSYYCTGGTTVASDVGRYHIMDRSTHALLSSSSAQSRLNLIQSSRNESETAVPAWVSSPSTHSASSLDDNPISPSASEPDDSSATSGLVTKAESFDGSLGSNFASDTSLKSITATTRSTSPGYSSLYSQRSDDTLQTSLDALHFIPPIECARVVLTSDDDAAQSEPLLQSRVAAITPILTSCYTSQGGSAFMAVEGLISLLNDTTFFAQDVAEEDGSVDGVMESSARLTLLDLAIQVVCDVATSSARETHFRSCVDFVSDAVRYAGGKLNDRTLGFALRFYLFVFYFGASIPTSGWPFTSPGMQDDGFLLSENSEEQLPGGAPQAAAIALKEFISIMLARIGTGLERDNGSSLVEGASDAVDVANYTQLALYQIHRSGGSELFWHDMISSIGEGLFGLPGSANQAVAHSNIISFAILSSLVKISSAKVRSINTEPVPRDIASKLLSLELLMHFIKMWHAAVSAESIMERTAEEATVATQTYQSAESVATMTYVVRRLVIPSLLTNTSAAIEDCRVYRRVLRIISQLLCNPYYRRQMKVDLAVLIEHFVLKVLCLGPQVNPTKEAATEVGAKKAQGDIPSLFHQQLDALEEIKGWFTSNPKLVLDLYRNYDSPGDMLPAAYCKLMDKLCWALSTLAEQCIAVVSEQAGRFNKINGGNGSPRRSMPSAHTREAAQSLRDKSFDAITAIAKSLMDCVIVSRKIQPEQQLETDSQTDDNLPVFDQSTSLGLTPQLSPVPSFGDENIVDFWRTIQKRGAPLQQQLILSTLGQEVETPLSFSIKPSASEDSSKYHTESFDVAFQLIANEGLKKGIDFLIACNLLSSSPRHIAAFLRVHQASIDPCLLGEYIGEGGIDGADKDFWCLIRFNFARATSFVGMNIEQALRHFLTDCGFRLPGEAQKIDRIISTFSQCYWEDNAGDIQKCPFQDQDTVFMVSFAIIMLNTDLHKHKSQVTKGKAPKRMTKEEFVNNLRGVYDGAEKARGYLYSIYDSIEATPIAISNLSTRKANVKEQGAYSLPFKGDPDLATSLQSWVKGVKSAQEILRTVSVRHDAFEEIAGDQDGMPMDDLASQVFVANWHHIHAAVNAAIDNAHLDLAGLDCCIDVLEYSLCTASYLGMAVERSAFSKLLGRVNRFNDFKKEGKRKEKSSNDDGASNSKADPGGMDFDVGQVRSLAKKLHQSLGVDDSRVETMKRVASSIRNGNILLNAPSRFFVREGDLTKKHALAGRSSTYRFFLFSDVLVYAHKSTQAGDYKVHEELPLHLMKIEDQGNGSSGAKQHSFYINHPNKSFLVIASSETERKQWVDDINAAIRSEVKRKAKVEKSRLEAARRAKI